MAEKWCLPSKRHGYRKHRWLCSVPVKAVPLGSKAFWSLQEQKRCVSFTPRNRAFSRERHILISKSCSQDNLNSCSHSLEQITWREEMGLNILRQNQIESSNSCTSNLTDWLLNERLPNLPILHVKSKLLHQTNQLCRWVCAWWWPQFTDKTEPLGHQRWGL